MVYDEQLALCGRRFLDNAQSGIDRCCHAANVFLRAFNLQAIARRVLEFGRPQKFVKVCDDVGKKCHDHASGVRKNAPLLVNKERPGDLYIPSLLNPYYPPRAVNDSRFIGVRSIMGWFSRSKAPKPTAEAADEG